MYIGDTGQRGIEHLINELVANGVDLFLAGSATRVSVSHKDHAITVSDDGPGLPFDQAVDDGRTLAETYFTELHRTATADGHSPHVHLNRNGLGLVVVSALSSWVNVISHRNGFRWEQGFKRGMVSTKVKKTKSLERGTSITFLPDKGCMLTQVPRWAAVRRKLFHSAHLHPGIILGIQNETFHAPGGLSDLAEFMGITEDESFTTLPARMLKVHAELDGVHVNAAVFGSASRCRWTSWCNGLRTNLHGTHVLGLKDALRSVGWTPAVALIHVLLTHPNFSGPTRSQLATKHVRSAVRQAVQKQLLQDGITSA